MSQVVLIVDDDRKLVSTLELELQLAGYATRSAFVGEAVVQMGRATCAPDLILLAWRLPDLPGTEVCRHLKNQSSSRHVPVIMLGDSGEELDRVVGLEVGAEDYVVKPFSTRELILRIRALLRRSQPATPAREQLRFAEIFLDPSAHRVWIGDREVDLTMLEFKLLLTLLERRGRVQTRERLLRDVWEMRGEELTTRTVDTFVKRVRSKLGGASEYIQTVRGVGYRFVEEPQR